MPILDEITNLILTTEEEYYGDGSSFLSRHKSKLLAGAGIIGAGALAHSGALGVGAQHFINSNARMLAQGGQKAVNAANRFGNTYPIPGKLVPFTGVST